MKKQNYLDNNLLKPFIKWAGGKNQLLPNIQVKYPLGLGKNINKYCEEFKNDMLKILEKKFL